jgi:hypothetical protein
MTLTASPLTIGTKSASARADIGVNAAINMRLRSDNLQICFMTASSQMRVFLHSFDAGNVRRLHENQFLFGAESDNFLQGKNGVQPDNVQERK